MSTTMMIGSSLGDFTLEAIIAEGGFGTVFRAAGGPRGAAAVKLLHAELAGSPEALAGFAREVDVLDRVRHPGIVEVLAVGRADDGRPWFAMELLGGRDLYAHIAERGRLTPAESLAILAPICEALAAAHDAGVIHRDVKASNVFLAADRVVLLDFGIAKLNDAAVGGGLTMSRQAIGSPSAMAPEQIAGGAADARSDIYSLGGVAFFLLTGRPPFERESIEEYCSAHLSAPVPRLRDRDADLPADLEAVITRCLAKDREARFPNVDELRAALEATEAAATWDSARAAAWWRDRSNPSVVA
jgi:serine/threonine protein kinase